jgi:hypothetical protein
MEKAIFMNGIRCSGIYFEDLSGRERIMSVRLVGRQIA